MGIEVRWPDEADEKMRDEVHAVFHAVVAAGGAIGFHEPPGRELVNAWLDETLKHVRAGEAALAAATVDGEVAALGLWRRGRSAVHHNAAEIQKVMAHPARRGLGLGRLVMSALVENARAAGLEVLSLYTRGNNHGAIELYESVGFQECGRIPNLLAVGDERWDEVWMYLTLGYRPEVVLHGSSPGGNGWSPRRA
ncbi:hypothetical protein Lesp02_48810 [Lentzea sp. NBRC 105346]|uniref:GNAT family N-acetyltransferase n=1 Tax=Lentzea sp. NBRC 105346 TaxID=3032205 RepID=UPI00249FBC71|nr:N-acetyltransferase [Lentzea sp. NBRC 105346]GLZ32693.1 hypothetical protein Lesp02_48810 [Lentzea sp. NBRC 105346]